MFIYDRMCIFSGLWLYSGPWAIAGSQNFVDSLKHPRIKISTSKLKTILEWYFILDFLITYHSNFPAYLSSTTLDLFHFPFSLRGYLFSIGINSNAFIYNFTLIWETQLHRVRWERTGFSMLTVEEKKKREEEARVLKLRTKPIEGKGCVQLCDLTTMCLHPHDFTQDRSAWGCDLTLPSTFWSDQFFVVASQI